EDGIRDYKVTGVQTCALPISKRASVSPPRFARNSEVRHDRAKRVAPMTLDALLDQARPAEPNDDGFTEIVIRSIRTKAPKRRYRSEERRVGKEGRCGGLP